MYSNHELMYQLQKFEAKLNQNFATPNLNYEVSYHHQSINGPYYAIVQITQKPDVSIKTVATILATTGKIEYDMVTASLSTMVERFQQKLARHHMFADDETHRPTILLHANLDGYPEEVLHP